MGSDVGYSRSVGTPTVDFYWDVRSTNTYFAVFLLPFLEEVKAFEGHAQLYVRADVP